MARSFFDNILDSLSFGLFSGGKNAVNGGGLSGFASGLNEGLFNGFMNPSGFSSSFTDFIGLTNNAEQEDAYNFAADTLKGIGENANKTYDSVYDFIKDNGDTIGNALGGTESISAFADAINNFNPEDFKTDLSKLENYEYGKSVDQFMDPAADYAINQSVKATQNAMAGQGGLSGGAAAAQLQAVASEKASELFDKAYDRMEKDKNFDYSKVKDLISAEANNNSTSLNAQGQKINGLGNLAGQYIGNMNSTNDNLVNTSLAKLATDSNIKQALAQLGLDKAGQGTWLSQILSNDGLMSGAGSLIKAIMA